jgi:hypothetical protein
MTPDHLAALQSIISVQEGLARTVENLINAVQRLDERIGAIEAKGAICIEP